MIVGLLAIAGGLGAGTRFLADGLIRAWLRTSFPIATVLINTTGSLLLGFLTGMVLNHHVSPELVTILGTGFLGGYTTFSTANVESVRLVQAGRIGFALASGIGTVVLAVAASATGLAIGAKL